MPELKEQIISDNFRPDFRQDSIYTMTTSGARALLLWSRQQTEGYNDVNIYNMTSSWRDGLAFCAIIHRYRPDLIDFEKLSRDNTIKNNELAFEICESHLDIPSILDIHDMVDKQVPDKLGVITFVSQLFNHFKDKIPANQVVSTKMNSSMKAKTDVSLSGKSGKRASHQIYALHGKAKKISSALKSVFRSDNKEDRLKVDDTLTKHPSTENLKVAPENDKKSETGHPPSTAPRQPYLGTKCTICHDKVRIIERLVVEHKLFHRACFKCSKCDSCLRHGTYSYCTATQSYCCIYECMADFRKKQEEIKIKLQPITDKVFDVLEQSERPVGNSSRKSSLDSRSRSNNLSPSFSIVKKNTITIGSLPKSFEDLPSLKSMQRRHSNGQRHAIGNETKQKCLSLSMNSQIELKKSKSDNSLPTKGATQLEVEVKRENGKVRSCVRINTMKPRLSPQNSLQKDDDEKEVSSEKTSEEEHNKGKQCSKEKVGLNDAYNRDDEERPAEGSVQKLRKKFMNIDVMIDNKHKQKLAKKNERMQREIRRVVRNWNEQSNGTSNDNGNSQNDQKTDLEEKGIEESEDSNESLGTSSGQSSTTQMEDTCKTGASSQSRDCHSPTNEMPGSEVGKNGKSVTSGESQSRKNSASTKKSQTKSQKTNLSVPIETSSSSPCSTPSPTRRTIPIIVRPSIESDSEKDERERSFSQTSSNHRLFSPSSDTSSIPDSPFSPMSSSYETRWPSQTSLAETSSSCSSPRMSIIIAQESSYTKVNSRFFTVETCESKGMEGNIIEEENNVETIDIEGEFRFGVEGNKMSKAQNYVLKSLRNCRIKRVKSDLVHEEEVVLSPLEMSDELHALETLHGELEKRGVEMEKLLRATMGSERPLDNEDEILREWLTLVQEKNIISRREYELIYLIKFHQYEDRYLSVECELRALLSIKDEVKSTDDVKRERALMSELFNLVQRRSYIVDKLEQDRLREKQEDENIKQVSEHGVNEPTDEPWENKQDYTTKVAFSRFYC